MVASLVASAGAALAAALPVVAVLAEEEFDSEKPLVRCVATHRTRCVWLIQ